MILLYHLLFRKECPTCNRLMPRSELERHVKRHIAGRASWENRKSSLPTFTKRAISDDSTLSRFTPA